MPAAVPEDRTPETGPYQTGGRRAKFFSAPRRGAIVAKDGETVTTEQLVRDVQQASGDRLAVEQFGEPVGDLSTLMND